MKKRIVIIGAGISGLSAGCYARMSGYDVSIVESHSLPGGLCTSWGRKGYVIDGSCHWLTGSGPGSGYHRVWEELGALQGRRIVDYEYFVELTGSDGRVFRLYTDVDRLERHMKELSPADAAPTEELCGLVRAFAGFGLPVGKPAELMGFFDRVRAMRAMAPYMGLFKKLGAFSTDSFSARFTDPLLREGIANAMFGAPDSLYPLVMTLGTMSRKTAGYPIGGSLEFARAIEKRFTGLGGTVRYGARAVKVMERDGRVTGVRLADGTEIEADDVVASCDMKTALYGLLDGSRIDPVHKELLEAGVLTPPVLQVAFGVDMDLSGEPAAMAKGFKLPSPVSLGGRSIEWFNYKSYAFDPSMAPLGKTVFVSMFMTDWPYWEKLKGNAAAYDAEKKRTAQICVQALETRYPGIGARIEMTDVATPLTFERFTGNWKGSFMTWLLTGDSRRRFVPKTVPGLQGFWMASMWTHPPGGLPGAARAGRDIVQILCARDGKRFRTSVPSV